MHAHPRVLLLQRQQRAAAADLDVIAMGADAQHIQALVGARRKVERKHARTYRFQTIQGQSPRASMRSKVILSLKVSIARQKPECR